MAKLTPAQQAAYMANQTMAKVMADPISYVGQMPDYPIVIDNHIIVFVIGFSPNKPLVSGLPPTPDPIDISELYSESFMVDYVQLLKELDEYQSAIASYLKLGHSASEINQMINKKQCWPCFAVVDNKADLQKELALRYEYGECDVDFYAIIVNGKVVIGCRMIPIEWNYQSS